MLNNLPEVMYFKINGCSFNGRGSITQWENRIILFSFPSLPGVGIQYRVASLGFLYFDTEDAPGNAGMFDQVNTLLTSDWLTRNHTNLWLFDTESY